MEQAKLKPGSTIQTLFSSFNSIFNKGGSLDQIKDLIGIDVTSDEGKAIARRISATTQGLDEGSLQAKIATLKFVIAADLARAEDSQGRLSDQDLARNLAKLGDKTYTTIPGAIQAIREIQDDIKYKLDSVKTLNQLKERARSRQYFTSDERRLLQADNLARTYISEYNRSTFSGGYVEEQISFTVEDVMNLDKFDAPDPNLQGSGGETVHRSKDGKSYVLLSRDGKSIEKQIPADSIGQAVDDRSITYTEVGGTSDVKGMLSPFGPDANPNVAPSTTTGGGGTTPPVTVPNQPPAVVTEVLGTDIGINSISDLGQADANGFYTVNGTQYTVTKVNPLTLKKVSP